jgi:hypothetical protein
MSETFEMEYLINAKISGVDEAAAKNFAADIIMLCSAAIESKIDIQNVIAGAVMAAYILCADDVEARRNMH